MAEGIAASQANKALDALCGNTDYTKTAADPWIQLHVGAPGAAGTSNGATETTRKQASFGAASGGVIANDVAVTWTGIAGSQDATHFSAWSLSSGGTFLFSGTITANAYTAGDTYDVAIGALTATLTVAS
jgi:hypothetical protein